MPLHCFSCAAPTCPTTTKAGDCPLPKMVLADDGTLDTVIACQECGAEYRYNFQIGDGDCTYREFIAESLQDAAETHAEEGCGV